MILFRQDLLRTKAFSLKAKSRHVLIAMLFAFGFFALSGQLYAQCSAPTFAATGSTTSTCASNGVVTIGSVSGGAGDYLEYALYNFANTTEVRPWQTATAFNDLASGAYTLRVRYVCSTGYSPEYNKAITIGGSYTPPSITSITVQRRAQCNNGRISIIAAGGTAPKTYALVASLSEPEPIALPSYVRVPQSSTIFDSLAAGTYYVRVYDACGSYATGIVNVASFTQVNPYTSLWHTYWFCDSLSARLNLNNLGDYVSGTADTLKRLWITYPNGSTDTLPTPNVAGSLQRYFEEPLSKLGAVSSGSFPENIDGTWPKYFDIGFKDACGNIFITRDSLVKPALVVSFLQNASASTCDSSSYRFRVTSNPSFTIGGLFAVNMNTNASFSLDSGATWQTVTTSGDYSQYIMLSPGTSYDACFAHCGDTSCLSGLVSGLSPFNPSLAESSRYACFGNSGIRFSASAGAVLPVAVEMLSGPDGQDFLPDTIKTSVSNIWLTPGRNLILGTYIFRFTDGCGRIDEDTITLTHPYQQFDASYSFPCGSTSMEIMLTNDSYWNVSGLYNLAVSEAGAFLANIYNVDSTLAISATYSTVSGGGPKITIPSGTISSLSNGSYFIRIRKSGADSCAFIDKPWEKTSTLISLSNSLTVSACPGTPTTGTVIAIAEGGNGLYSYSLYDDSVSAGTLVAGPQPENIFNGLDESKTYIVTVSDTCGRGTQASMSFGSTPLPVYSNAGGLMPCPGDTLVLAVRNMPGVNYLWYKNNDSIAGAINPELTIPGISDADSGNYKVALTIGSCTIFLSSFELNPSECGTPLNVNLLSFTASVSGKEALLSWVTSSEQNNKGFGIERSDNGKSWIDIGFAESKASDGNSMKMLEYEFTDNHPLPGDNYYRLKQVDYDGKSEYSPVEKLQFKGINSIVISPNPTKGMLYITGLNGGESITITNVLGQKVFANKAAMGLSKVDIGHLPSGIYLVTIANTSEVLITGKISKE